MLLGSVEGGGTKFVCAVGNEDYRVLHKTQFPTTDPQTTIQKTIDFFKQFPDLAALSIASFGPIELKKNNPHYGYVTDTPKIKWRQTDLIGPIKKALQVPIYFTTDVNASAYGEYVTSQLYNEKIDSLVYYTIGTGVGGGAVLDGKILQGIGHPEMGHTFLKRHPDDLDFAGICPYHKDCLEGLVSGPTFEARLGIPGPQVPKDHHVWDILAYYVAQAAIQQTMILRPDNIVFGGGVVSEGFLDKVREQFSQMLNGYVHVPDLKKYIQMPRVQDNGSATLGNFALAYRVNEE
ncbi:MAG: ROK family protein [Lactobacillus sp.]|uniref:Fructokinase n=1 Tax=Bombilactobacillus bombi TaxID=1303590 RepID=A0A347STA5_9LACO|nr:fructokinase ScrK [Bombilactobacillus bombi]MCO6542059.1 ROK family protein [Lactobacillus sp.]AXX65264.1 ROK family protein [Bombilactobacillus bombi]MCO6543780.1 ROK family protein [Lactobacillus sp.]RHW46333.1 fructokinase/branched chain amino acid--2-keto-4-methylthiobutyrate aminotransferase [Bombilactobacillus bombi]RHW52335.1 fructokinase/branched chain amino acid--2-keto-4-methylthiobutyrate aminotransferase [Bombilactobacillus bombi]